MRDKGAKAWKLNSPSSIAHSDFVILLKNASLYYRTHLRSAAISLVGAERLADRV